MNNHKLFLAASTAIVAVATVAAPVNAESSHPFTDVAPRYDEAVSFFYEYDIIKGKTATQFGTTQQLTRGDAAVILANALDLDTAAAPNAGFTDLNTRTRGAVNALAAEGIVSGVTKTEYKPNEILSRGAMAKFLVTAFELQELSEQTPFTDVGGVFGPYIEALYGAQITNGKTATTFGTHANITRGEFANLLFNTIMFVIEDSFYFPEIATGTLVSKTSFKLQMTEAIPAEYRGQDIVEAFYFSVNFDDGTDIEFLPTTSSISKDRMSVTFNLGSVDLDGKTGHIVVDDLDKPWIIQFDYSPVATPEPPVVTELPVAAEPTVAP